MPAPIQDRSKHHSSFVTVRFREDEKQLLEERAKAAEKPVAEWCREVLLATVQFAPDYRSLLAEFCAMRKIVLDLHTHLAHGQAPANEIIKGIVQDAEANKFTMADRRIVSHLHE